MTERTLTPGFRHEGDSTDYPFVDGSSLTSSSGQVIGTNLFQDAILYPVGNFQDLHISSVSVDTRSCIITIRDSEGEDVATAEFNPLSPVELLALTDVSGRPAGVLVVDAPSLAELQNWPQGLHAFSSSAAQFVASCVIPTPEVGVRALQVGEELISGDVVLIGEGGVVLRQESEGVIRVDIVGDPLFARRLCRPLDLFQTPNFLRTINGIGPDEYGNFNFTVIDNNTGDTILRVIPEGKDTLVLAAVGQRLAGA